MVYCTVVRFDLINLPEGIHVIGQIQGETQDNHYILIILALVLEEHLPEFLGYCLRQFREATDIAERESAPEEGV